MFCLSYFMFWGDDSIEKDVDNSFVFFIII